MNLCVPSLLPFSFAVFAGAALVCPAAGQAAAAEAPSAVVGRILALAKEELQLVRSIKDEASAKAAAPRIAEIEKQCMELDAQMEERFSESLSADEEKKFLKTSEQLFDVMEEFPKELSRLDGVKFYGSEDLKKALSLNADANGEESLLPVGEEDAPLAAPQPMTAEQETAELARMAKLAKPDREFVQIIKGIRDEASFEAAQPALDKLTAEYAKLLPAPEIDNSYFNDTASETFRKAYDPVSRELALIHAEFERIAALDEEVESLLAESRTYDLLLRTHDLWFGVDSFGPEEAPGEGNNSTPSAAPAASGDTAKKDAQNIPAVPAS